MTLEEARKELIDFEGFSHCACNMCNAEWYCPTPCDVLLKAKKIDFDRIVKCYARNDGDWVKIFRYIKSTKTDKQRQAKYK